MGQMMNLFFDFDKASVYDIREVNSSFARGSLKVLYLGENRNGSYFTKDAVERALPSLKNVPIVCHWDSESGEIGGHDMEVAVDSSGELYLKNLTEPCGVVPDHAVFRFVTDCDEDGNEHEYLVIDGVLLWKRQDVYSHIINDLDGKVKHSMEINVFDGSKNANGYYNIREFEFTALCLLESCEPCFQGSELEVYSANNFKLKMEQMMAELKEYYSAVNTSEEVDDISNDKSQMEGGEKVLENNETVEEIVETFASDNEEVAEVPEEETAVAERPEQPVEEVNSNESFALTNDLVDELVRELSVETITLAWGDTVRYWYVNSDFELNEVYCIDANDWLLYGFSYALNGDAVEIDFNSKKRMKYAIVPFDEGEQLSPLSEVFSIIEAKLRDCASWESKYHEASNQISTMEAEVNELRQFKATIDANQAREQRDAIFEKFSELNGVEAFEALRENAAEYDLDTLEEKCYAIRGRNMPVAKFSLENKSSKLVVSHTNNNQNEPYGELFKKFAPVKSK